MNIFEIIKERFSNWRFSRAIKKEINKDYPLTGKEKELYASKNVNDTFENTGVKQ